MENSGERTQQPATAWKTEKERYENRLRVIGAKIAKDFGVKMEVDVSCSDKEQLSGSITFHKDGDIPCLCTNTVKVHYAGNPDNPDYICANYYEDGGEYVERMRFASRHDPLTLGIYLFKYIEHMIRIENGEKED